MTFFRISRKNVRVYDDYTSFVVRACNLHEARKTAAVFVKTARAEFGNESFDLAVWEDPNQTTVEIIELSDEPQVISAQFRHG